MNANLKLLLKDNIIKLSIYLSIILLLFTTVLIAIFYNRLPPCCIPFLNSMPWGKDRFASPSFIVLLPIIAFIVIVINNILSVSVYTRYSLIARILSVNAFLFILFSFLALLQILLLVF